MSSKAYPYHLDANRKYRYLIPCKTEFIKSIYEVDSRGDDYVPPSALSQKKSPRYIGLMLIHR